MVGPVLAPAWFLCGDTTFGVRRLWLLATGADYRAHRKKLMANGGLSRARLDRMHHVIRLRREWHFGP